MYQFQEYFHPWYTLLLFRKPQSAVGKTHAMLISKNVKLLLVIEVLL